MRPSLPNDLGLSDMVGAGEAVLGVDGCPGGWVGALVHGRSVEWRVLPDAAAILAADASVIAIDIPIGLPEPGPDYRRRADIQRANSCIPGRRTTRSSSRPYVRCSTRPRTNKQTKSAGD